MNRSCFRRATLCAVMLLVCVYGLDTGTARAQQSYQNIVNQRFRTVSNGPQSAIVLDVDDPKDRAAVSNSIDQKVGALLHARNQGLVSQLALLRQRRMLKPSQNLLLCDVVILRHRGRLALPTHSLRATRALVGAGDGKTRDVPANNVTFHVVTKAEDATYGFADGSGNNGVGEIQGLLNRIIGVYNSLLGPPLWNGTVNVRNKDVDNGGKTVHGIFQTVLIANSDGTFEIDQPTLTLGQDRYLALAQAVAQAWYGPNLMAYDAWSQGMGRAAAVIAAHSNQAELKAYYNGQFDPVSTFYYTPYYDQLNQPALGNNTFSPPTKSAQLLTQFGGTSLFGGMLIPRLQMASTVWLKCYIENNSFFKNFNNNYYNGLVANSTVKNDVNALRMYASAALPLVNNAQIEGDRFDNWFERQFVLDTSVTPGPKVYAFSAPTFPDSTHPSGATFDLVYYRTVPGTGDEQDLSGTVSPTYFDYQDNRQTNFEAQLSITNGEISYGVDFGTVSNGQTSSTPPQRFTIDFPVNNEYTRVFFPVNETQDSTGTDNGVSGVLVGANTGQVTVQLNSGRTYAPAVTKGAFGTPVPASDSPEGFYQVSMTFSPSGAQPTNYKRNIYYRAFDTSAGGTYTEIAPIFVLNAPSPNDALTLTQSFNAGAQMISLPIKPYVSDLAKVLGIAPQAALLAQYRQDTVSDDKYSRYPTLPAYQPGYGLWANFATPLNALQITGERTDVVDQVTVALQFGWNQIGNPFAGANLDISNGDAFQILYLNNAPLSFSEAVAQGYVGPGVYAYNATNFSYENIADTAITTNAAPANKLVPWSGYWFLVTVPEGITLTYVNPSPTFVGSRAVHPLRAVKHVRSVSAHELVGYGGWRLPVSVRDSQGHTAAATLGQSPKGSDSYVVALDAASPPAFTRSAALRVRFPHADWSTGASRATDFLSDIRRTGSLTTWDVAVDVPQAGQTYTLNWGNTNTLPRGTRLMLVDKDTGARQLMNNGSSYDFTPGKGALTRNFQIVAEPKSASRIWVHNLNVAASIGAPGRATTPPATISYEVSGVAEATIAVRSGNGRLVRHLVNSRAVSSGVNQAVWDMRDDQGHTLPVGIYVIEVTARTPEGEQFKAITTHVITR